MSVAERCARWAEAFRARPLPPEVVHHAKRAVIDWYAAALPGAAVPPATLLERAFESELGGQRKCFLMLGRSATPRVAALINGTAAHTVEVDDIFRDGIYHPGAPTIAAALALAQAEGASGERFLRAVTVGY
jgi:2-methylcitrate dehydratase PrpD